MNFINEVIGKKKLDNSRILKILKESLSEKNPSCPKSIFQLQNMNLNESQAVILLAFYKSEVKYGYKLSYHNVLHLFKLAESKGSENPLKRLLKYPFLLVKTCWLYEHAPYFIFYNKKKSEKLDEFILEFASNYESLFLNHKIPVDNWKRLKNPKRVRAVTFWENQIIDPVSLIKKVKDENLEGLELSLDFHPFNYTKLLPEEFLPEKRKEIRNAIIKSGVKVDIHSPIVGPYSPYPDPAKGSQLFYNPSNCYEILCETIEFAEDIGAGSIVIHLIDNSDLGKIVDLILKAGGTDVRITLENYCQTTKIQHSDFFIESAEKISSMLPEDIRKKNFGITLDVGHINIEGQDPLVASEKIGIWCKENNIYLRVHSTDNYGKLLFSPPSYSADVHGNVSGRGINNAAIIKLLRSMGHRFDVVAEQIRPLTREDIEMIHKAQTTPIKEDYESIIKKGNDRLSKTKPEALITSEVAKETAYQFLTGIEGVSNLREHLIYRKIQDKKYLSVDEVRRISQEFMKMPQRYKDSMIDFIDNLLLPIQSEDGILQKSELDLICQNISGTLFGTINNEHLNQIFSQTRKCNKDEVICEHNSIGQEMYLIKEGEVEVSINGSHLAFLGPGEIFGEISLFYNLKRTATIKSTKENTVLGTLTRKSFEALLKAASHIHMT